MQFRNVTVEQAKLAAEQVPARLQDVVQHKSYFTCTVKPTDETDESLRSVGRNGRRVGALSYEGHREFFDNLYRMCPDAEVISSNRTGAGACYYNRDSYVRQVPSSKLRGEVTN